MPGFIGHSKTAIHSPSCSMGRSLGHLHLSAQSKVQYGSGSLQVLMHLDAHLSKILGPSHSGNIIFQLSYLHDSAKEF